MKLVVMLIWVAGSYGGPTTIQGFKSIGACNRSIETIVENWPTVGPFSLKPNVRAKCVELSAN